jgi:LEA14-like dessication related protein
MKFIKTFFSDYLFYNGYPGGFDSWKKNKGVAVVRYSAGICLLGLLFMFTSCLGLFIENPTFTLKGIKAQQVSLSEINFTLDLRVNNPNKYDLELKSLDYKFYLNDKEAGEGSLKELQTIRKACESDIRIPLNLSRLNLADCLIAAISGQEVRYKLIGKAKVKAGLASASIPFDREGVFNGK